jgi:transcriptional regulator with XRE-family HTH domain
VDDQPVGRRVAYWRTRRRMSQQVFADRLGKSKSWVDKVERGVRRLDKFSTIAEIAQVLQVDVTELMGREQPRRPESPASVGSSSVSEIRGTLERYDKITPFHSDQAAAMPLPELRKAVDHAWMTFQHANYTQLARSLPRLIRDAQSADGGVREDAARSAAYLLAEVYQIASSTLRKLGEHDLAWLAADRATMVCQRAGDELLTALSTDQVAAALSALGRVRPALEISVSIAEQVAPRDDEDATPQRLSVYGMVLLRGALAAARLGHATTVRDLLSAAEEAAKKVGDENFYWTSFGPTNVAFYQVAAEVELGEAARALRTHSGIDPDGYAAMLPERRASHLVDVARAHAQVGNLGRAGESLVAASRLAPNELRCRPDAQELVVELMRRNGGPPAPGIQELADQIGLSAATAAPRA